MRFAQLGAAARRRAAGAAEDDDETITVPVSELETRAKEVNVFDVRPFLASPLFVKNGYVFDEQVRTISKRFGAAGGGRREEL